jgi:hypothetical protein
MQPSAADKRIVSRLHAAENYIAKRWSLEMPAGDNDHAAVNDLLRPR